MEAKFTKGVWRTSGSRDRQVFAPEGMVADCACQWADDDDEDGLEEDDLRQQENAKLVSAAPDLYEALEAVRLAIKDSIATKTSMNNMKYDRVGIRAVNALKKARGEQ